MQSWSRPYEQGNRTLVHVLAGVVSAVFLFCFWPFQAGGLGGFVVLALYVTAVLTVLWRWVLRGVFVGDAGIKIRRVLRTIVIPWRHVRDVQVVEVPSYRNNALVVRTQGGRQVRTLLWERSGQRFGPARVPATGIALPTEELAAVATTVNDRVPDESQP